MAGLEVKVDIAGASTAGGGDSSETGGLTDIPTPKGIGKGISGAIKGLGIAAAIGFIADVVLSFKPLVTIVTNILKLISLLLRPVADAITTLLTPVLIILKPIVRSVNQLFRPFITLALSFLKAGETGKATATILGGLGVVLIKISSEVIKLIGSLVITTFASLFGLVSEEAQAKLNDELLPAFFQLVDEQSAIASSFIVLGVAQLGETGSEAIVNFVNDSIDSILTNYPSISKEVADKINDMKKDTIKGDFDLALTALTSAAKTSLFDFGSTAADSLNDAMNALINAATSGALESLGTSSKEVLSVIGPIGVGRKIPAKVDFTDADSIQELTDWLKLNDKLNEALGGE